MCAQHTPKFRSAEAEASTLREAADLFTRGAQLWPKDIEPYRSLETALREVRESEAAAHRRTLKAANDEAPQSGELFSERPALKPANRKVSDALRVWRALCGRT